MEQETWKDIPGFEGLYQASTLGRVRSLPKQRRFVHGTYISKIRILKPSKCQKGYLTTRLWNGSNPGVAKKIHRLVAETFIPNERNMPQINHKNCIKDDNRIGNLEWTDNSGNQIHAFKHGLNKRRFGEQNTTSKQVVNIDTNEVFACARDAHKKSEISITYSFFCSLIRKHKINFKYL